MEREREGERKKRQRGGDERSLDKTLTHAPPPPPPPHRPKTEIEWVQHRARKLPAPWSYQKQEDKTRVPLRKLAKEAGTSFTGQRS